jgi:hypothetical protein
MAAPVLNIPPSGKDSTAQTQVEGDIKIRIAVLWIVGIILILLVLGAFWVLAFKGDAFQSYWATVLPILSGAIFGLIGFIAGRKVGPER